MTRTGTGHESAAPIVVAAALGISADALELEKDGYGRPVISAPATDLRFSVAHSCGLTLIALAIEAEVGVDVECFNRDVTDWMMWEQTLTRDEISHLPADRTVRNATLLRHWVRREALLKAAGVGVAIEPRSIELSVHGRIAALPRALAPAASWSLHDVAIPGYAAAIACRPGVAIVEVGGDVCAALLGEGSHGAPGVGDHQGPGSMHS